MTALRLKDGKIVLNLFNKLIAKAEKNNMGDLTKRAKKKWIKIFTLVHKGLYAKVDNSI